MRPASGVSNPASRRSTVVLPLPDGPSSARISPRAISSDTGPTVTGGDHRLRTPSIVTKPVAVTDLSPSPLPLSPDRSHYRTASNRPPARRAGPKPPRPPSSLGAPRAPRAPANPPG